VGVNRPNLLRDQDRSLAVAKMMRTQRLQPPKIEPSESERRRASRRAGATIS
jgi:hypothetical protein